MPVQARVQGHFKRPLCLVSARSLTHTTFTYGMLYLLDPVHALCSGTILGSYLFPKVVAEVEEHEAANRDEVHVVPRGGL